MAGFTCGTDPSLIEGTRVVVPNVPETEYTDERQVTILREGHYKEFFTALAGQEQWPNLVSWQLLNNEKSRNVPLRVLNFV